MECAGPAARLLGLAPLATTNHVLWRGRSGHWGTKLRHGDNPIHEPIPNQRATLASLRAYLALRPSCYPLVTPFSDRFHRHRALFFAVPVCIQIAGLLVVTYAGADDRPWPRYGGLLIVGFGLGPTVPVTMTWTNELFQPRHGEVGVAAASAVVSGWGNLGSILTTYALYTGWASDAQAEGMLKYRKSNLVMVGILCGSILAAFVMQGALWFADRKTPVAQDHAVIDGAARRETQQRGLHGLGSSITRLWRRK